MDPPEKLRMQGSYSRVIVPLKEIEYGLGYNKDPHLPHIPST